MPRSFIPLLLFVTTLIALLGVNAWWRDRAQTESSRSVTIPLQATKNAEHSDQDAAVTQSPARDPAHVTGSEQGHAATVPAGSSASSATQQALLPPIPEKHIDMLKPHAVPAERAALPAQNLYTPPAPHARSGYFDGTEAQNETPDTVGARPSHKNKAAGSSRTGTGSLGQFSGYAQVESGILLKIGESPVQLFGIRSPSDNDRCGAYHCVNVARVALQGRLSRNSHVYCRASGKIGEKTYAICLDSQGADLGGYLVGEGLARADAAQTSDYVGAERIARDLRRGLWQR